MQVGDLSTLLVWAAATAFLLSLIAYAVDESGDEVVVSVLGVFSGGQDWASALRV